MATTTVASTSVDSSITTQSTLFNSLADESSSMSVTDILRDVDSSTPDVSSGEISVTDSIFSQNETSITVSSTEASPSSPASLTFSTMISSTDASSSPTTVLPTQMKDGDDDLLIYILVPLCLVIVIGLILLVICCLRRRKKAAKKQIQNGTGNKMWVKENQNEELPPADSIELSQEVKSKSTTVIKQYRAIHKFEGQEDSHLKLEEGDTVVVKEKAENGWLLGTCGDLSGWFPESYVELISEGQDDDTADSGFCERQGPKVSSFMLKKKHSLTRSDSKEVNNERKRKSSAVDVKHSISRASVISTGEKFYKAVYDYTAAYAGEISLKQDVVVMGREVDKNGWMRGVKLTNGDEGWFPAVYVDEITEDEALATIQKKSYKALKSNRLSNTDQDLVGIEHVVLFPYVAEREDDLSLDEGDKIVVFETLENGWWLGCKGQEAGWFPGSFVELLRREPTEKVDSSSENNTGVVTESNRESVFTNDGIDVKQSTDNSTPSQSSAPKIIRPARKAPLPPSAQSPDSSSAPEGEFSVTAAVHTSADRDKTVKPARRAPVPPSDNRKSFLQTEDSDSGRDADSRSSSTTPSSRPDSVIGLNQSQKPYLPPRWVRPSVIKVPRKKLAMMNLSDRPSRPLPPAPIDKSTSNQTSTPAPHAAQIPNKGFAPKAAKRKQGKPNANPNVMSSNTDGIFVTNASKEPPAPQRSVSQPSSVQDSGPYRPGRITRYVSDDIAAPAPSHVTVSDVKPAYPTQRMINSNNRITASDANVSNVKSAYPTQSVTATNGNAPVIQKQAAVRLHPVPDKSFIPTYNKQYLDVQIALNNVESDVSPDSETQQNYNSQEYYSNNSRRPKSVHDYTTNTSVPQNMHSTRTFSESDSTSGVKRQPPPKQYSLPSSEYSEPSWQSSSVQKKGRKLKQAIADFTAENPEEISFTEGSFIREISKVQDRPGWSLGMLADGTTGLFPSSYVGETPISSKSSIA